ncbi:MAG: 5-formyltetrahydrofolate cyclo-ligase [Candidatus Omnitrophica bacterium]|jgi:5-formyltetrahydrofolate cyclo-ligase|nr:5-formyltetrahydrofolate cyclo-ligase [Candidatus Omnitrophota bacterium]
MLLAVSEEKKELRKKLLAKLLSLTGEELKRRSQNVEQRLSSLPIYKSAKVVTVYYPLKGEVNILGMVRRDLGLKRFCFPFMDLETKDLEIYEINNLEEDFSVGPFGVMQPDPKKTKKVDIKDIDMVIVPAVAFDRNCNRLGRGKGFYDHFLKKINPPCKKVGIAFESQILDDLPIHPSMDEKVDVIVSENFTV